MRHGQSHRSPLATESDRGGPLALRGQSGNPKGRPKRTKDFDKLIDRELSATIRITDGGESKLLTKRELIIKRLINEALNGDKAALKLTLSFMKANLSVEGFEPDPADQVALLYRLANSV